MAPPSLRVVLVDDAPEVRSLVRTHLRLSGRFTVVGEGASGLDAVALAEQHRPDLVLLDVSMPLMDGLEALPRVLSVAPGTRVVLFSGFDERGLAARGRDLGAVGFIEKSVSVERLAEDLLALLEEGTRVDATAAVGTADAAATAGQSSSPTVTDTVATAAGTAIGTGAPTGAAVPVRPDGPVRPGGPAGPDGPGPSGAVLAEDLERFREVFEEAAIGMATMTLTGHVVRANRALGAVVGRGVDELVGVPYADLTGVDDAEEIRSLVTDLAHGRRDVAQVEHTVPDREPNGAAGGRAPARWVAATLAVVRGREGRPLYLFLQGRDVTEQRQANERLRQSEERFRLLVEAVEDYAIFMLDPQGCVASWNSGAQRIKGYSAEEIVGRHFREFYPLDRQSEGHPERELRQALTDGRYEEEGWRVRKDGTTFWANVVITAVHDATGEHVGFAKITRDITERRYATEQREQAAQALERAKEELEVMNARLVRAAADQSQFLAVTAHELRTPVAVLGGSASTLATHWRALDDDERSELFDGMVSSAARLRRLLADLLTAARLEAGAVDLAPEPVRVADVLVESAVAGRRGRDPGDVEVVGVDTGLTVLVDRDRFAQAVDNLVGNALRHGAAPVRLSAAAEGGAVVVRVTDAGPGVPAAVRAQLFDRFVTGERRGGTGLGLFIVRELARAQGGDAWYEEAPLTTFALALPRVRGSDPGPEAEG